MNRTSLAGIAAMLGLVAALATPAASRADDGEAAEPKTFSCCTKGSIERIVQEYVDLYDAMLEHEDDDDHRPSGEMYALDGVIRAAIKKGGHSADDRQVLLKLNKVVDEHKDDKIGPLRDAFKTISKHVVHLAMGHQGGDKFDLAEAFCEDDGVWLQKPGKLRNPYGNEDCGQFR